MFYLCLLPQTLDGESYIWLINGYYCFICFKGETLDSNLTPILEKNVIKHKGGYVIKCGDQMIEYNSNFRLYITTCLRNPHYSPEIMVMVSKLALHTFLLNI